MLEGNCLHDKGQYDRLISGEQWITSLLSISTEPSRHLTTGIGDPTATHVKLADPPGCTSTLSGGMEKWGGTLRTAHAQPHTCSFNENL